MTFLIWLKEIEVQHLPLFLSEDLSKMKQVVLLAAGSCIFVRCLLPNWLLSLEAFHSLFFKLGFFASTKDRLSAFLSVSILLDSSNLNMKYEVSINMQQQCSWILTAFLFLVECKKITVWQFRVSLEGRKKKHRKIKYYTDTSKQA